jgi:glycosyltransferase involved in cell wall biosynthesis
MENKEVPKVSVIVPVYNVSIYLDQCLKSITAQTLEDIEIIVINDGSSDDSSEICEKYASADSRIRFYNQDNIGLGETRNRGIDLSRGEYLAFVDSDDYLGENYIESLYEEAEHSKADITQGEDIMFFEDTGEQNVEMDLSKIHNVKLNKNNAEEFLRDTFFTHIYKHYAWNKLYRADFIKKNNLRFGDNKKIFAEDTWFQLQALHFEPYIAFSHGTYYYYRQRKSSIMHSSKQDLLKRQGRMIYDYVRFLRQNHGDTLEVKTCGMISMDVFTMEALNQINIGGNFSSFSQALKDLRKYKDIYKSVCDFNKNESYILENNSNRRKYLRVVSELYDLHLDKIALGVIWMTYKVTRG